MNEKLLVIATHPDDETLGCGGTLLRYKEEGAQIHWLIVTSMTKEGGYSAAKISKRQNEIYEVNKLYDFTSFTLLDFPASRLDEIPMSKIVSAISEVIYQINPTQVILPYFNDVHTDHQQVFSAAYSCTKSFRFPSVKKVMMMEVPSETDFCPSTDVTFSPNFFVNITNYLERKLEILRVFEGEIKPHPFPRSEENIRALAILRGATAGFHYAESFVVLKEII